MNVTLSLKKQNKKKNKQIKTTVNADCVVEIFILTYSNY